MNSIILNKLHECCFSSILIPTTEERLAQAKESLASVDERSLESMRSILLNDTNGSNSIQSAYHREEMLGGLQVGTCATITMDLGKQEFYARKGPGSTPDFHLYD